MRTWTKVSAAILCAGLTMAGCGPSAGLAPDNGQTPSDAKMTYGTAVVPTPLVTVNAGKQRLLFWPYTGADFAGQPQDPINLIFFGQVDPRDLRTALMSLDGNRAAQGFPSTPPFNARWEDAIGDVQTAFVAPAQWLGGPIQLQCGSYQGPRFHIRMFKMGLWTVANAHFEALIPGTTDHQVLSWELAEQLVVADLMRSGLLDPVAPVTSTAAINQSPFKAIPATIYNQMPAELRSLIGGPMGNVSQDVPLATDGRASLLRVASRLPYVVGKATQEFTLMSDQVIPKPFCASGPEEYLSVTGPVRFIQTVSLSQSGNFTMDFQAEGDLSATPVDPLTGQSLGATMPTSVRQTHTGDMTDKQWSAASVRLQYLGKPADENSGRLYIRLRLASEGNNVLESSTRCPK
jgi:hypothetical protein